MLERLRLGLAARTFFSSALDKRIGLSNIALEVLLVTLLLALYHYVIYILWDLEKIRIHFLTEMVLTLLWSTRHPRTDFI